MTTLDVIAVALVVLAMADWFWTAVLLLAAHYFPEAALQERATTGVVLSFVATLAAVLGLARLNVLTLDGSGVTVVLVVGFLAVSLPQWIWGIGLITGRFR